MYSKIQIFFTKIMKVYNAMCGSRNIHTHPKEGHWTFRGGPRGVSKAKLFKGKYEAKREIPRGRGVQTKKNFRGGGTPCMDIFWNHTILLCPLPTILTHSDLCSLLCSHYLGHHTLPSVGNDFVCFLMLLL